ncbi:hypothetical protein ACLOJK_020371 [Asimina triloba]
MALSRSKIAGEGSPSAPGQLHLRSPVSPRHQTANNGAGGLYAVSNSRVQAAAPRSSSSQEKSVAIKAVVTVKPTSGRSLLSIPTPGSVLDGISDWIGKSMHLQLVAAELDPSEDNVSGVRSEMGQWPWIDISILSNVLQRRVRLGPLVAGTILFFPEGFKEEDNTSGGNVTSNHFIELINEVKRAKVKPPRELMVPYVVDEGRHIHLGEEA